MRKLEGVIFSEGRFLRRQLRSILCGFLLNLALRVYPIDVASDVRALHAFEHLLALILEQAKGETSEKTIVDQHFDPVVETKDDIVVGAIILVFLLAVLGLSLAGLV
jgi:TRAP-type uncharacterized transport system fused permease subunit